MENNNNNNKESNNNNKEISQVKSLIGVVGFLSILLVGFLVGSFIRNLFIDFLNQNKDEWISVYNSKNLSIYYNPSKIFHTQNGNVRMWIRVPKSEEGEMVEGLVEIDCKNQNLRYLYSISYGADKKIVYEEGLATDSFSPVVPGSLGEGFYKLACENQSFLCKLPFFVNN
jgi:hypothetical protein